MATEALSKFAQELKTLREERGITLVQISNRTKIDIKFLQAIEEARFEILPEIYVRAFIKEYVQTLDLIPKTILEKYENAKSGKEDILQQEVTQKEVIQEEIKTEQKIVEPPKPEYNSTAAPTESSTEVKTKPTDKLNYILGGFVLLIALLVFYFAFIQEPSSEIYTENESSSDTLNSNSRYEVAEQTSGQETQPVADQQQEIQQSQVVATDSLQLSVQTLDRVWVKVYTDGKVIYQQMVDKNTNLKYRAKKSFAVSVGDAGDVKIFFNNKQVPNIGKQGESRNIYITPETIRYYTIQTNEKKSTTTN